MVPAGDVIPIFFSSYDGATGASEAITGLAITDIEIFKDGSVTQRASDAGYTLLDTDGIDFDGITGINGFSIDTGDNTDASFYTVGAWFTVVVSSITADGQTVNFIPCQFRLMAAEAVAAVPKADATHFAGTAYATALAAEIDANWDEPLTGATHNVATSSGRRLRTASGGQFDSGTAQAGGADSITLATSASTTASLYVGCQIAIDGGTGSGQSRYIVGYTAARIAYVARHWTVTPDNTSTYVLYADNQVMFIDMGLAQGGAASTITLASTASATNDIYNGQVIRVLSGTGDNQIRSIVDYDGATKIATVDPAWTTQPDNTSYYGTLQTGLAYVTHIDTMAQSDVRTALGMASANLDTQLGDLPTNAELATALGTADDAVLAAIAALNNLSSSQAFTAVATTQLTESYAADGAAPTIAQALFLIQQRLTEMAQVGTTITVNKVDGSTPAYTLTLDSATAPTTVTRAT